MDLQERSFRFDLNRFKKIEDEGDQAQYALETLQQLGEGGSRMVFRLSPKYVLKIAYNDRGKNQNATEAAISEDPKYNEYIARVHSHAPDFSWVISDLVRPLREGEFEHFFGMPFEEFVQAIDGRDYWRWQGNPKWKVSGDQNDERIGTYGHVMTLRDLVKSKKLWTPELKDIGHWGKTGDGRLVILDYGVDSNNWRQQTMYAEGEQKGQEKSQGFTHPGSTMHSEPILEASSALLDEEFRNIVREYVQEVLPEVVKKCGSSWCLYTKKKGKNGKRRRLGTHKSKKDAYRQEIAIQYSKHRG